MSSGPWLARTRKEKGSTNRARARVKVAKAHVRVTDARRDFLHKVSTELVRENQAVYVEDLAVQGLARTRLAKSVHDAGWGMFLTMLEEKAARYGRTFAKIERWFPVVAALLGVRGSGRPEAPAGPGMGLPDLRHPPRPRSERGTEHPRRGT